MVLIAVLLNHTFWKGTNQMGIYLFWAFCLTGSLSFSISLGRCGSGYTVIPLHTTCRSPYYVWQAVSSIYKDFSIILSKNLEEIARRITSLLVYRLIQVVIASLSESESDIEYHKWLLWGQEGPVFIGF